MMKTAAASAVAFLIAASLCADARAQSLAVQRILFVGNSLTTANDLPGLVEALARAANGPRVECHVVAFPNFSLEDHLNSGDAPRPIAVGGWTGELLHQGPSALPESRALLVDYVRRFDGAIKRAGARTALYMVWPAAARQSDFEGVKTSYAAAARAVDGLLLPVGEAWRAAWRRDSRIELYDRDGLHPTPLASYLAALVIYQKLSGRSPVGMPETLTSSRGARLLVVPPVHTGLLQQAAAEANASMK